MKNYLRVHKDGPLLVFERVIQGGTISYDFATKTAYGLNGQPVKDIRRQLASFSVQDMIDGCEDERYGNFIKFIQDAQASHGVRISNIGTILYHVPEYSKFEQYFSAGLKKVSTNVGNFNFADVPTNIIRICREHDLMLTAPLIKGYKEDPNGYTLAFSLPYVTLKDNMEHSLVTLEVVGGKIVQAKQAYNNDVTPQQRAVIDKWNEWYQSRKAG